MSLRVIAVQNWSAPSHEIYKPVVCCVYKDKQLFIYDTNGELYLNKEYISDIEHLKQLVHKGTYQWSDFTIDNNKQVAVDFYDNIVVDNKMIIPFQPLENSDLKISKTSIKLYYEFLKTFNKINPVISAELDNDYQSSEFQHSINDLVAGSELTDLSDDDKYLAVGVRLEGYHFIVDFVKSMLREDNPYKYDEIHHLFSRIFILEKQGYIILEQ